MEKLEELLKTIEELKGKIEYLEDQVDQMYTEAQVEIIMRGACWDGRRGLMPEDVSIYDYI